MNLFDALMGFAAGLMVGITAALWATYYDMAEIKRLREEIRRLSALLEEHQS